ncbi:hypothetical protein PoB_005337700 [Plakobranchus ocellatus]|uniref:Uncharacterized protein n=1 Tax=Plakobranchus ocellatus TaxID=259542 RepID=A0AAV4C663_9GAST|nr:hypothetical protein PoB_005337700 [Plakobranchus ocellatus]
MSPSSSSRHTPTLPLFARLSIHHDLHHHDRHLTPSSPKEVLDIQVLVLAHKRQKWTCGHIATSSYYSTPTAFGSHAAQTQRWIQ